MDKLTDRHGHTHTCLYLSLPWLQLCNKLGALEQSDADSEHPFATAALEASRPREVDLSGRLQDLVESRASTTVEWLDYLMEFPNVTVA